MLLGAHHFVVRSRFRHARCHPDTDFVSRYRLSAGSFRLLAVRSRSVMDFSTFGRTDRLPTDRPTRPLAQLFTNVSTSRGWVLPSSAKTYDHPARPRVFRIPMFRSESLRVLAFEQIAGSLPLAPALPSPHNTQARCRYTLTLPPTRAAPPVAIPATALGAPPTPVVCLCLAMHASPHA